MATAPPQVPSVVRVAERLLKDVEHAVSMWPRSFRYTTGTRLREQAFDVADLAHRAWRAPSGRGALIEDLVTGVDRLRISLQLGQQLKAFRSKTQFEAIARVHADLGRQVGGWRKHLRGQNETSPASGAQRAQILSPRAASAEAQR